MVAPAFASAASAAAAKPGTTASTRQVVRVVFKQLQRLAALHDSRPALKGLLESPVYTDPSFTRHWPRATLAVDRFYGRGCRFYVDSKSLTAFIRHEFARYRDAPHDQTPSLLSDAFYTLRMLKANAAKRNSDDRLAYSEAVLAVDPAAPANSSIPLPPGWAVEPVISTDEPPATPTTSSSSSSSSTPPSSSSSSSSGVASSTSPPSTLSPLASILNPSPASRKRGRPPGRVPKRSLVTAYSDIKLEPGLLLIAHPAWDFHSFTQSVVLVTSHDDETGTEGVILNRPLSGLVKLDGTDDIERSVLVLYRRFLTHLHSLGPPPSPSPPAGAPVAGPPLLYGGPVTGLRCLHRLDAFADVSREVVGGEWPIYAGELPFWEKIHTTLREAEATPASLGAASGPQGAADVELFLGRCVWAPGQLQGELRTGAWLLARGNGLHVFTQPKQAKLTPYNTAAGAVAGAVGGGGMGGGRVIPMPAGGEGEGVGGKMGVAGLVAGKVPGLVFPWQSLWAHCVWQQGGEFRALAQVEETKGRESGGWWRGGEEGERTEAEEEGGGREGR